jgi:signal transduction histidine kinase
MQKKLLVLILMYLFILLIILYGFWIQDVHIVIPALLVLVILLILGFIVNTYVLQRKYDIDENVLHLTREILHELAIPISTIQANSLMLSKTLKEDQKSMKRLARIDDSSRRLERLYEELLYSIKKEIQSVEKEKTDLVKLIKERVEVMRLFNRNTFNLSLEEHYIFIDKIGFEKMIDNLLTNAMKYSSKDKPIDIILKDTKLIIQDYGIGMPEEALKNAYKRYYQSSSINKGQGIGLALVSAYCSDEKIEIKILSKEGEGTTIILNLSQVLMI